MKLITALVVALFVAVSLPIDTARSQGVATADAQEFQRIISAQIDAFRADDGPSAYSYAAPLIHKAFPTSDVFMEMVRKGYRAGLPAAQLRLRRSDCRNEQPPDTARHYHRRKWEGVDRPLRLRKAAGRILEDHRLLARGKPGRRGLTTLDRRRPGSGVAW